MSSINASGLSLGYSSPMVWSSQESDLVKGSLNTGIFNDNVTSFAMKVVERLNAIQASVGNNQSVEMLEVKQLATSVKGLLDIMQDSNKETLDSLSDELKAKVSSLKKKVDEMGSAPFAFLKSAHSYLTLQSLDQSVSLASASGRSGGVSGVAGASGTDKSSQSSDSTSQVDELLDHLDGLIEDNMIESLEELGNVMSLLGLLNKLGYGSAGLMLKIKTLVREFVNRSIQQMDSPDQVESFLASVNDLTQNVIGNVISRAEENLILHQVRAVEHAEKPVDVLTARGELGADGVVALHRAQKMDVASSEFNGSDNQSTGFGSDNREGFGVSAPVATRLDFSALDRRGEARAVQAAQAVSAPSDTAATEWTRSEKDGWVRVRELDGYRPGSDGHALAEVLGRYPADVADFMLRLVESGVRDLTERL